MAVDKGTMRSVANQDMTLCIASTTTAGSMPVFSDWADKAVCHNSDEGPIYRIENSTCQIQLAAVHSRVKICPFSLQKFFNKRIDFLGRKSS